MTAHADINTAVGEPAAFAPALEVHDTQWGFVVTELQDRLSSDTLWEVTLKFGALVLVASAVAQWLLPGSLFSGDVIVMKLLLTAMLCGLALVLFRYANRGFSAELQVDAALREIRIGTRTAQGSARIRNRIAMRDIEECFLRPSDRPGLTEICFRVSGHEAPVPIAAGTVAELAPVLERLTRDLRTPRERVALRMAS